MGLMTCSTATFVRDALLRHSDLFLFHVRPCLPVMPSLGIDVAAEARDGWIGARGVRLVATATISVAGGTSLAGVREVRAMT